MIVTYSVNDSDHLMKQPGSAIHSENIEIHVRNYRTQLKSAGSVKIDQLVGSHVAMHSVLHEKGDSSEFDASAFIYSLLRLPSCIYHVKKIILGQSYRVFRKNDFAEIDNWQHVEASGRRRKMYFDGKETLAVYIGSVTDVDDVITLLTAYQIEWNKLHEAAVMHGKAFIEKMITPEDRRRIEIIVGDADAFWPSFIKQSLHFNVRLLSGSYVEYMRATQQWWNHISEVASDLSVGTRPIYFVSSNLHSLANLVTGTAVDQKAAIISFLKKSNDTGLLSLWEGIESAKTPGSEEYFLNYLAKKYERVNPKYTAIRATAEKKYGIHTIAAHHNLDINVQIIEIAKLKGPPILKKSEALIVNIDYPLGWAAYQVLTEIAQNVDAIRGVYVMGKAATLTGQIGDISLPSTVFDQHTKNAYAFNNALSTANIQTFFKTGAVLSHQKAITVKGTFFESDALINEWYREGYTTIEMEAGPFLSAIYESVHYNRYVEGQFVSLLNTPFEVGIAHYASDTPNSKGKNLGARNLSYEGVECTYGITAAILKRIIDNEVSVAE